MPLKRTYTIDGEDFATFEEFAAALDPILQAEGLYPGGRWNGNLDFLDEILMGWCSGFVPDGFIQGRARRDALRPASENHPKARSRRSPATRRRRSHPRIAQRPRSFANPHVAGLQLVEQVAPDTHHRIGTHAFSFLGTGFVGAAECRGDRVPYPLVHD